MKEQLQDTRTLNLHAVHSAHPAAGVSQHSVYAHRRVFPKPWWWNRKLERERYKEQGVTNPKESKKEALPFLNQRRC